MRPETRGVREDSGGAAGGSPAEFGAHTKSQIALWGKVVTDAGIKIRE